MPCFLQSAEQVDDVNSNRFDRWSTPEYRVDEKDLESVIKERVLVDRYQILGLEVSEYIN